MKKLLSLLAVFCLILSLAPIGALAATPAATLLFDLSLEGSTAELAAVSNKVTTDKITEVNTNELQAATDGNLPIYKTEADGAIEYLTFAYLDNTSTIANKGSQINVIFAENDFGNGNAFTYEMWARPTSYTAWSSMFALGGQGGVNEGLTMRMTQTGFYSFYPDMLTAPTTARLDSSSATSHMNTWNHYVVTQVWDSENTKWDCAIYVNGKEFAAKSIDVDERTDYLTKRGRAPWWNTFVIGNVIGNNKNKAFEGDIAEFRIYEGALTAAEASAEYEDTKATYEEPEVVIPPMPDGLIFDMDISGSSAGNIVVTDTSNASQVKAITPYGASNTAPIFGSEDGVDYLSFTTIGEDGTTLSNRKSKIAVELVNDNIADKAGVTFEAWARAKQTTAANSGTWGALASIGAANTSGTSHIEARFLDDASMHLYPDRAAASTGRGYLKFFTDYKDTWAHYVFIRERVTVLDEDTNENVEKWQTTLYINNVLHEQSYSTSDLKTEDYAATWLSIGGSSSSDQSRAFIGDIADFRLYSKALSVSEITASFNADAGKYVSSDIGITWKSGDETLDSTANIANLTTATAEITVANYAGTNPYIFVASYKGKELVKVERAEFSITGTTVTATGTITWETSDGVDAVKAFIWNDGLSPLCQPQGL